MNIIVRKIIDNYVATIDEFVNERPCPTGSGAHPIHAITDLFLRFKDKYYHLIGKINRQNDIHIDRQYEKENTMPYFLMDYSQGTITQFNSKKELIKKLNSIPKKLKPTFLSTPLDLSVDQVGANSHLYSIIIGRMTKPEQKTTYELED